MDAVPCKATPYEGSRVTCSRFDGHPGLHAHGGLLWDDSGLVWSSVTKTPVTIPEHLR